jgi:hypothetical protein
MSRGSVRGTGAIRRGRGPASAANRLPAHAQGYDPPRLAVFPTGSALVLAAFAIGSLWWFLPGRDLARDEHST